MKAAEHIHQPWPYGDVMATVRRVRKLEKENKRLRTALGALLQRFSLENCEKGEAALQRARAA